MCIKDYFLTAEYLCALALLLENFARQKHYVPETALSIDDAAQLPERLRRQSGKIKQPAAWRAWRDDATIWFLVGRLARYQCSLPGAKGLEVLFFSQDGETVAAGAWELAPDGSWVLCRPLDASIANWGGSVWSVRSRVKERLNKLFKDVAVKCHFM